jgi:hypothetical protein
VKYPRLKKGTKVLSYFLVVVLLLIITWIIIGYFGALSPQSYLPKVNLDELELPRDKSKLIELKSPEFSVMVNKQGRVSVKNLEGEILMSDLVYYASYEQDDEKWELDSLSFSILGDSAILFMGKGLSGTEISVQLTVPGSEPRIDIDIVTHYTQNVIVSREAFLAVFNVPVSEVYKKNRQVDITSFDTEYWLQKQGVRFGESGRSALIYNTPGISSMQLNTERNLLFMNLECSLDHPYINIPYQENNTGRWEDQSMAIYTPGSERRNFFSIYFCDHLQSVPRLMSVPYGYLAGYVFTEHADGGNIKTNQAVYFGSDSIADAQHAMGGFMGNGIPVTKSVFYADPDNTGYSSIKDDHNYPQFLNFLDQLYRTGIYDICLHTPENGNSNRELMDESIRFMKDRYDAVTWVDHGMYGGKINRECFTADGLNQSSEFYAADLWEKYGTNYFWSPAVELIHLSSRISILETLKRFKYFSASVNIWRRYLSSDDLRKMDFISAFNLLLHRYIFLGELQSLKLSQGESHPEPLFWSHPTRTKHFYSWATDYVNDYEALWTNRARRQCTRELKNLRNLVSSQSVYINHGYYVRNKPGHDLTSEVNGRIMLNPYFEEILNNMAQMRDDGDLYLTTIRDLLDYWISTENISFRYFPDGTIILTNNNNKPIKGLSMIIRSSNVLADGKVPEFKRVGDDTVFWFDLPGKDQVVLQITPLSN